METSRRAAPHVRRALAARLRALRAEHQLTQARLGRKAGLSPKFIGEVERAKKSISVDSLYRITTALGVPLHAVLDLPRRSTTEAERVLALMTRLSPAELRRAYLLLCVLLGAS